MGPVVARACMPLAIQHVPAGSPTSSSLASKCPPCTLGVSTRTSAVSMRRFSSYGSPRSRSAAGGMHGSLSSSSSTAGTAASGSSGQDLHREPEARPTDDGPVTANEGESGAWVQPTKIELGFWCCAPG